MAELVARRPSGYDSTEINVNRVVNLWASPVAATEPPPADDSFLRGQEFDDTAEHEYFFLPANERELHQILRGSKTRRKMIIGSAFVAALAVGALGYVFWPTAIEKQEIEVAQADPAVQSAPVAPVQAASPASEPLPVAAAALGADLPPFPIADASPRIAAAAPWKNSPTSETALPPKSPDIVFLQRPGVKIRSAASTSGEVVGTAPRGTRFKVTTREGDWVRVESGPRKGWINSQFLAPTEPR
jgi:hypothetical protein